MKFKIFLLTFVTTALVFLASHYFFVNDTYNDLVTNLKDDVSRASSLYKHINRADSLARIRKAEKLASKKELLDAYDQEIYKYSPEDVSEKIMVELNIINKFYDDADIIFVTDIEGYVVARNLDETMKGLIFKDNMLIRNAISGRSDEDIIKIMGKLYRVTSVSMRKDCQIIGTFSIANRIDSEMAKNDFNKLAQETSEEKRKTPLYFAFLNLQDKDFLGSNMPPDLHQALRDNLTKKNVFSLETFTKDSERKHALELRLNKETFYSNIAKHPQLDKEENVHYIILSSIDQVTSPLRSAKNNFLFFTGVIVLLSFMIAFALEESFMSPMNNFMEGMLEIINGNRKYKFNNDVAGIEGNLNQNANYMIAVLLGEQNIDEEKSPSPSSSADAPKEEN